VLKSASAGDPFSFAGQHYQVVQDMQPFTQVLGQLAGQ
jgi:hypothetical protein